MVENTEWNTKTRKDDNGRIVRRRVRKIRFPVLSNLVITCPICSGQKCNVCNQTGEYELESEGLSQVCTNIEKANIVPAFMAEITETVKANMIYEDSNFIKAEYIQNSLESYLRQVQLAQKKETYETNETKLGKALVKVLKADEISETVEHLSDQLT